MGRSGDPTKKGILDSLRELLKDRPLDSITPTDIAHQAGIARQTFYYHFDSVQDVFFWAIGRHIEYSISSYNAHSALTPTLRCYVRICDALKAYEDLTRVFARDRPKALYDYIHSLMEPHITSDMGKMLDDIVSPEVIRSLTIMQTRGYVGTIERWIGTGMESNPIETIQTVFDSYPAILSTNAIERVRTMSRKHQEKDRS